MVTAAARPVDLVPPPLAPASLQESGLTLDLVVQLCLKTLFFGGELGGTELASRLGVPFAVIDPAVEVLKSQRQVEISAGSMLGPPSFRYRITDAGRERASLFLEQNHYAGFAPVPLEQYRQYMKRFGPVARNSATREAVRRAFSHLVVPDRVVDQVGPAVNAGHSLFVYGPPGNGKTVLSQAIRNLLAGDIMIPHAIEVEGSIIRLFDPVNHEPVRSVPAEERLDVGLGEDRRWIRCARPLVMVGGELTLEQLDLTYSPGLGFYRAPVQAVANGGVLVIDDFGRQACSPRDLLNRWIVPLENRVDYLTLQTGQKIDFPFLAMIVFATNIRPAELVDEAFLRRIHYKVFASSPTVAEFMTIFENCCRERGLQFRPDVVRHLLDSYYRPRHIEMRGCHPRDLLEQARSLAEYLDVPFELDASLLEAACASYFLDDQGPTPAE